MRAKGDRGAGAELQCKSLRALTARRSSIVLALAIGLTGQGLAACSAPVPRPEQAQTVEATTAANVATFAGGCFWSMEAKFEAVPGVVSVIAGGCFWSMEAKFEAVPGVVSVIAGVTGGTDPNLTFEKFAAGNSGYIEAVQVTYDPARVSYRQLVDHFWRTIDPGDPGGQFCDRGANYGTAVFATRAQWDEAQASRVAAQAALPDKTFVTPVRPVSRFWPAPPDQQDFARTNPDRYAGYNRFCRRDEILRSIWGDSAAHSNLETPEAPA